MPVLMVSEKTWPHVGFSRNRSIDPSSRVITMPNSRGFSMALSPMVASALRSWWKSTTAARSMSVTHVARDDEEGLVQARPWRCGPSRRCRAGSPRWRTPCARRTRSRCRSRCGWRWPGRPRSPRCRRSRGVFSSSTMCSIIGRLAIGIIGFGWLDVRGRSRVPSPAGHDHGLHTRSLLSAGAGPRPVRLAPAGRR